MLKFYIKGFKDLSSEYVDVFNWYLDCCKILLQKFDKWKPDIHPLKKWGCV